MSVRWRYAPWVVVLDLSYPPGPVGSAEPAEPTPPQERPRMADCFWTRKGAERLADRFNQKVARECLGRGIDIRAVAWRFSEYPPFRVVRRSEMKGFE